MNEKIILHFEDALQNAVRDLTKIAKEQIQRLMLEADETRKRGLAEVEEKRKEFQLETQAMHHLQMAQDSRIVLDVGGHKYATSISTLQRQPGTLLSAMVSGRFPLNAEKDGTVFIDRDGTLFEHVMTYVRDGVVAVDAQNDSRLLRQLKREFGFFAIDLYEEREVAFVFGDYDVNRYDSEKDSWTIVSHLDTPRLLASICMVAGLFYISGGFNDSGFLTLIEVFDPATNSMSKHLPMPSARHNHGTIELDSLVYMIGGVADVGNRLMVSGATQVFDPSNGEWDFLAPLPKKRTSFGLCKLGRSIYVLGGLSGANKRPSAIVYRYDVDTNLWSVIAPMPIALSHMGTCVLDGSIYVPGGMARGNDFVSSMFKYDRALDTWYALTDMAHSRAKFGLFEMGGLIYAAGGDAEVESIQTLEAYDPAHCSWSCIGPMQDCNTGHAAFSTKSHVNVFDAMIARAESMAL